MRHAAAVALGEIGPYVWDVASARNDAQKEGDPWVGETFGRALAKVLKKAPSAKTGQGDSLAS